MEYCIHCMAPLEGDGRFCPECGAPQAYHCPEHHLRPGTMLNGGRIMLGAAIGSGGFGITYIARDMRLEMPVAIKEFYPVGYVARSGTTSATVTSATTGNDFFERGKSKFLAEAKILATLNDEAGIVDVRDFFEENNTAYIVMEYLRGETLKSYLSHEGKLSFHDAYQMLRPVME